MKKLIFAALILLLLPLSALAGERYIVTFEVKQSHFTFNIGTHIKDAMNTLTFEIPIDKAFYDTVKAGDILSKEFRTASLILKGSFGNWKVRVKQKTVMESK